MAKAWSYKFEENTIRVVNSADGSELYINDKLQDKKNGLSLKDDLQGKLPGGQEVKASLGGVLTMRCSLFVDNVEQKPVDVK